MSDEITPGKVCGGKLYQILRKKNRRKIKDINRTVR